MTTSLETLHALRQTLPGQQTRGLDDAVIERFLALDPRLSQAIGEAAELQERVLARFPMLRTSEVEAIRVIQDGYVNFYASGAVNPYVALAARGPWVVTLHGAVIHDSGGYGMLGFGHNPPEVLEAMARPQVMANIMTANGAQLDLDQHLRCELGHAREHGCPFDRFLCMNSGSEAMTLSLIHI